jgi:hypothetical protein
MSDSKSYVKEKLEAHKASTGETNVELAGKMGLKSANFLSMVASPKYPSARLPLERIAAFAKHVEGASEYELLALRLEEDWPEEAKEILEKLLAGGPYLDSWRNSLHVIEQGLPGKIAIPKVDCQAKLAILKQAVLDMLELHEAEFRDHTDTS